MVTEPEEPEESPQAPEDMENSSDIIPENTETYISENAVNMD